MRTKNSLLDSPSTLRAFLGFFVLISICLSVGFSFPDTDSSEVSNSPPRSIGEYREDVKTFMKLSKSEDQQLQRNAIFNLCELHWELISDPRFETNQQVQGYRVVIAKRLETFVKEFQKSQHRAERLAKKSSLNSSRQTEGDSDLIPDDLADANGLASTDVANSEEDTMMYQSSVDSYSALGRLGGGPNQLFGYAGGRLGPPWDHGPELVALIQNTINPEFWQANGGNGVIHYFRPLRVLVIGASTQVHEDTLELLYKLRAAGQ
jgi:hypothetical protein